MRVLSAVALAFVLSLAGLESAKAANFTVVMANFTFSPTNLTIGVGDTVTWTNAANNGHDSSSGDTLCHPSALWGSGQIAPHTTFKVTFTNYAPGTYTYICTNHCAMFGMKNALIITNPPAVNIPPTVAITNLTNGTVFQAPANVTIQANANDTDGTVTNVQFLIGSTLITNDSTAPFSGVTNGLPAGSYSISAVASDNNGAKATNVVSITVNPAVPPSISLDSPTNGAKFIAPANVQLQASVIETSGTVTNVQFRSGATPIGVLNAGPFNFTVTNFAAGNYAFSATAMDTLGAGATSGVVNVFVLTNATLVLPHLSNGQFQATVLGIAGQTYVTEGSSNLINWSGISTNLAPANSFNVIDSTASNILYQFYRARQDLF